MAYENNHYVPQLILRKYGTKINRYNLKTKEYLPSKSIKRSFSANKLYPVDLEKKLNTVEASFANLLNKKILKADKKLILSRDEIALIKKFLVLQTFRVPDAFNKPNDYNDNPSYNEKLYGFKEKTIPNETYKDYIIRSMNVIIDCKDISELLEHPDKTYEAVKWCLLYNNCYITIWDSKESGEDFFITDRGMTCEHEKTRFHFEKFGIKEELIKTGYLLSKIFDTSLSEQEKSIYANIYYFSRFVYANYYMFSISETRMIGLINPWFRLHFDQEKTKILNGIPDVFPCMLSREAMKSNSNKYINAINGEACISLEQINSKDEYIYEIKNLTQNDVFIINCLMLDRTNEMLGFVNTNKIIRSLNIYSKLNTHLNDFSDLKSKLENLGYDFPDSEKYIKIAFDFTKIHFTKEEQKYICFMFDFIKKCKSMIK